MLDSNSFSLAFLLFWGASSLINFLFNRSSPRKTGRWLTVSCWIGLALQIGGFFLQASSLPSFLLHVNPLSQLLSCLILFVGAITASYSKRYLAGAKREAAFYCKFSFLIFFLLGAVSFDHIFLFVGAWLGANLCLSSMMVLNPKWEAARQSARISRKYFIFAFILSMIGAFTLSYFGGSLSIFHLQQTLEKIPAFAKWLGMGSFCIAALIQSGVFPFHRWMTSSLNSPTPLSALMHAGLVNGGGIILARFIPFLENLPLLMGILFIGGALSTVVGTLSKLCQNDYKRMLASSTVGQMGFMFMQCGLGLFPAAMAHLFLHGLFKAHLFLRAGSALSSPAPVTKNPLPTHWQTVASVGAALCMGTTFSYFSHHPFGWHLTSSLLVLIVAMAGFQASRSVFALIKHDSKLSLMLKGWTLFLGIGALHGLSVRFFELLIGTLPSPAFSPTPLYAVGMVLLVLGALFTAPSFRKNPLWKKLYFQLRKASSPAPETVTKSRVDYQW